jgi:hypothetical protein
MARADHREARHQVNVPLNDEHLHVVLLQLSIRDGKSVPELLRPVIVSYLRRQLAKDAKLAAAVAYLEQARADAIQRRDARKKLAPVTELSSAPSSSRRKTATRKPASRPQEGMS